MQQILQTKILGVNTIIPGGYFAKQNRLFIKKYSERVPLKEWVEKNEINGILSYLTFSKKSSYVTGQEFIIDGGLTAW